MINELSVDFTLVEMFHCQSRDLPHEFDNDCERLIENISIHGYQ